MLRNDPERFDHLFGSRGAIEIGLYEAGMAATGLDDPDDLDAA